MIFAMVSFDHGPAFSLPRNRARARIHNGAITAGEDGYHPGRHQRL